MINVIPTIQDPSAGLAGAQDILGLDPNQFAAIAGGIGSALAPPDTWQSRLGSFAAQLGKGRLVGERVGKDVKGAELKKKEVKPKKEVTK